MSGNDYITISEDDLFDLTGEDTISLADWDSPLKTTLSGSYTYNAYPATTISAGAVGATLSTTNTGSLTWNNQTYATTASPYSVYNAVPTGINMTTDTSGKHLHVNGGAIFEGDIKIKGVNLSDRLDAIEERLGILRPNNDLEGKWEKLKALGEEYRKLEKEILEGESIWDTLKK